MSMPPVTFKPKVVCAALGVSRNTLRGWHFQQNLPWLDMAKTEGGSHREYTTEMVFGLALTKRLRDDGFTTDRAAEVVRSVLELASNQAAPNDLYWATVNGALLSGMDFEELSHGDRDLLLMDSEAFYRVNIVRLYKKTRDSLNRFAAAHWAPDLPGDDAD